MGDSTARRAKARITDDASRNLGCTMTGGWISNSPGFFAEAVQWVIMDIVHVPTTGGHTP
jgi:hypothetical protein